MGWNRTGNVPNCDKKYEADEEISDVAPVLDGVGGGRDRKGRTEAQISFVF